MSEKKPINTKVDQPVHAKLKSIASSDEPQFPRTTNMKLIVDAALQIVVFGPWEEILKEKDDFAKKRKIRSLGDKIDNALTSLDKKKMIYDESRSKEKE